MTQKSKLVHIATCDQQFEAQIYKGLLEDHSIPCFVDDAQHDSLTSNTFGSHLPIDLWVPESLCHQAIALLESVPEVNDLEREAMGQ